ncbi:chemotaxis protein CheW [Methylovorus mays]|uniref:chemotaxis protein CheW n=1 Tax=Methylovorus mays TaxID=184077 RepID=UPI0022874966|nr:chemotaxis protein CheW [Methylovorus mays]
MMQTIEQEATRGPRQVTGGRALPQQTLDDKRDGRQYLTFMLGVEVFAINILRIKEIIEYGHLTMVPQMPSFIRGVINLRGAAVPVIDLAARFDRADAAISRKTCIVILEVGYAQAERVIGVMVDAVNEVLEIASDQIEPVPSFGTSVRTDFIDGMGKVDQKFVIILNVNQLLSANEMAELVLN